MVQQKPSKDQGKTDQPEYIRPLILDWNIVHYWLSRKMRESILPVLSELDKARLQFCISEVTVYEAQCQLPVGKDADALQFIEGIPRYPVDTATQKVAGVIRSCYKDHDVTKQHASDISLQDIYNASCTILTNGLLLTADYHDYPRPFFDDVWHWTIKDDKGRQRATT